MNEMTETVTRITCPECGHQHQADMPKDSCIVLLTCPGCQAELTPRQGDCCIFCSYGTVPCPAVQCEWENGQLGVCCSGE